MVEEGITTYNATPAEYERNHGLYGPVEYVFVSVNW